MRLQRKEKKDGEASLSLNLRFIRLLFLTRHAACRLSRARISNLSQVKLEKQLLSLIKVLEN